MNPTTSPATDAEVSFWQRARRVAFWSVVVGVALEVVLLGLAAASGRLPAPALAFAAIASKVSWSFVVCLGISFGVAAADGRAQIAGLLGAVSGPIGLAVARSVHKGTLQALSSGTVAAAPDVLSPLLLAGIKVVEYGVFGLWLGRIARREDARIGRFLRAGTVIGIVFAGLFLALFVRAKPEAGAVELVSKAVNELAFPIGCSLVVFVTKRTSALRRA